MVAWPLKFTKLSGRDGLAAPAVFKNPGAQRGLPARLLRRNVLSHAEIRGIQLEDLRPDHGLLEGIEILVVENTRIVVWTRIENPLPFGVQVSLHRLAFDFLADRVLLPIRVRHIVVIECEQAAAQNNSGHQNRNRQAVQADAGGFEGRDLVVFGENSERHQHRDQHAERRRVVDQLRRQEEQIGEYARQRDMVFNDVAQQLEERVDVNHQHEAHQQDDEVKQKALENVGVHHLRDEKEAPALALRRG